MARILVTGASGFIGRALVPALAQGGHEVRAPGRAETGDIGGRPDWRPLLEGCDGVVHLAGLAHARHGEAALWRVNVEATAHLAEQAARAGVRRFLLMSSVKAAIDRIARPLTEADAPAPETAYGRSKLAAEATVLQHEGLRPVILRPPLVYGAEAQANFAALLRLADTALPLPFAGLGNHRSLIARESLVEAACAVMARPLTPGEIYYVADRPALSTGSMIRALRQGFGRPSRLFHAPWLVHFGPAVLSDSLEVNDAKFRAAYSFRGKETRAGLAEAAVAWKTQRR